MAFIGRKENFSPETRRRRRAGKDSCLVGGFKSLGKMEGDFSGIDFQEEKETFTKSKMFISEELFYLCSVSSHRRNGL